MIWNMLFLAGVVAAWVILNRWVLPKFGIRTLMSASCGVGDPTHKNPQDSSKP